MQVWYPRPLRERVISDLRLLVPEHEISASPTRDAEMLIEGRPSDEQLDAAPNLRWVVVPFAGVPHATLELLRTRPQISLHNLHHNAAQTAETALALLFAAAKRVVPIDQCLRRDDWTPRYEPDRTELLAGKRCLLLGAGAIGMRLKRALEAMDLSVTTIRRRPRAEDEYGPDALLERLPFADVLMVTLPHTAETEGLLGRDELALLPEKAIVVNVARAQIIDEAALYEALEAGKLHSAGLDVWYRYPQASGAAVPGYFEMPESARNTAPSAYPFGKLDNVVMSPYRGGTSARTEELRIQHLADLIRAAGRGEQAPNRVDLELGY